MSVEEREHFLSLLDSLNVALGNEGDMDMDDECWVKVRRPWHLP